MRVLRTVKAAVLCAAAMLFCGCGEAAPDVSDSEPGFDKTQNTASSNAAFSEPQNVTPVEQSSEITYFGSADITAAAELFAKNSGGTVVSEKAGGNYIDVLSEKISSDNSPDLCDKVDNTYPYLISMNLYEDLTNYIDTTSPQWADITDYIDYYAFKGARCFYPTSVKIMPQFLMYDKMAFVRSDNVPDPEKLWLKGEWTWSAMKSGSDRIRQSGFGDYVYLAGGYNFIDNLFASSGSPLFPKDESSRFMNGFVNETAGKIPEFIGEEWLINHNDDDSLQMRMLNSVFLAGDEQTLAKLRQTQIVVGIVPFPVEDSADKYYCKAVTEGFLVPKGAKNIQSAASFINCSRIYETSEECAAANNKKLEESGLLRSDVEWLQSLRSSEKLTPVLVECDCFDDFTNETIQKILTSYGSAERHDELDEVFAECLPIIDNAVENINAVHE